jgi:hypothetical protein
MKIKEVVEALKEKGVSVEKLADGIEGISQKGFKTAFIGAGYQYDKSKRSWFFAGEGAEEEVLEKDIFDFSAKAPNKPKTQQTIKPLKQDAEQTGNKPTSKQDNKEAGNQETQQAGKQLKKVTYEIEEELHDKIRIKAIMEKRTVSEIVNGFIKQGLNK